MKARFFTLALMIKIKQSQHVLDYKISRFVRWDSSSSNRPSQTSRRSQTRQSGQTIQTSQTGETSKKRQTSQATKN